MKRPRGRRPLGRGEPVVRSVLGVTLDELARGGFAALRVEDVADRAGVNKTTVYRRWPTKAALVRAALLTIAGDEPCAPDTGSLRGDLVQIGQQLVAIAGSPRGQSIIRMILAEGPRSELGTIARSLHESHEPLRRRVMESATARGEVATVEEGLLLLELLNAALHFRLFVTQLGVAPGFIEDVVDLLVSRAAAPRGTGPGAAEPLAPRAVRPGYGRPAETAWRARRHRRA